MKYLLGVLLLLISCGPLVCRHNVLSHAGWAAEQGLSYKVVVYQVSPAWSLGAYNAHAQVKTDRGWVSDYFGYMILSDGPTFSPSGWLQEYDTEEYMKLMGRNCFNNADCNDVGIP